MTDEPRLLGVEPESGWPPPPCGGRIPGRDVITELEAIHKASAPVYMDPTGKSPHEPGAKLDLGKNRLGLVLLGFPNALKAVGQVGTYGANKYTDSGWRSVPDGQARYTDALLRHQIEFACGEADDAESGLPHLAHAAWNALAVLELYLVGNGE